LSPLDTEAKQIVNNKLLKGLFVSSAAHHVHVSGL